MSSRDRLADKWSLTHRQVDKARHSCAEKYHWQGADGNLESKSLGCGRICCNGRKLVSAQGGDCSMRSIFPRFSACAVIVWGLGNPGLAAEILTKKRIAEARAAELLTYFARGHHF